MIKQTHASQSGFDPDRLHRIDDMMDRYVAEGKTAGMVTLLSRNGEIAHFLAQGYMDIAAKTPKP